MSSETGSVQSIEAAELGVVGARSRRIFVVLASAALDQAADHLRSLVAGDGVRLLVVVTGAVSETNAATRLRPIQSLGNVAYLYVGKGEATMWDGAQHNQDALHLEPAAVLAALREILLIPEVFDEVVMRTLEAHDGRVASIGFMATSLRASSLPIGRYFGDRLSIAFGGQRRTNSATQWVENEAAAWQESIVALRPIVPRLGETTDYLEDALDSWRRMAPVTAGLDAEVVAEEFVEYADKLAKRSRRISALAEPLASNFSHAPPAPDLVALDLAEQVLTPAELNELNAQLVPTVGGANSDSTFPQAIERLKDLTQRLAPSSDAMRSIADRAKGIADRCDRFAADSQQLVPVPALGSSGLAGLAAGLIATTTSPWILLPLAFLLGPMFGFFGLFSRTTDRITIGARARAVRSRAGVDTLLAGATVGATGLATALLLDRLGWAPSGRVLIVVALLAAVITYLALRRCSNLWLRDQLKALDDDARALAEVERELREVWEELPVRRYIARVLTNCTLVADRLVKDEQRLDQYRQGWSKASLSLAVEADPLLRPAIRDPKDLESQLPWLHRDCDESLRRWLNDRLAVVVARGDVAVDETTIEDHLRLFWNDFDSYMVSLRKGGFAALTEPELRTAMVSWLVQFDGLADYLRDGLEPNAAIPQVYESRHFGDLDRHTGNDAFAFMPASLQADLSTSVAMTLTEQDDYLGVVRLHSLLPSAYRPPSDYGNIRRE